MFGEDQKDYLMMLNSPDYENLASPPLPHDYVNGMIVPDMDEAAGETSGYLCMKTPADIFSPRSCDDDNFFDFQSNKKQKSNEEFASGMELQPMLHSQNDSDTELPLTPPLPSSYLNPSYQKGLAVQKQQVVPEVKTLDNYVNMPHHKELMKSDKKCLAELVTPAVTKDNDTIADSNSRNYVNSNSRDWERPNVY